MRNLLSAVLVLSFCVGAFADPPSPAQVGPVQGGKGLGNIDVPYQPINPGDEIYNTLYITNQQLYDAGNGDSWSGNCIWGTRYDLQVCDDVEFERDCCLDVVVRDYVAFGCNAPAACYVALHAESGCAADNAEFASAGGQPSSVANFTDTIFGLVGRRISAQTDGTLCAPAGRWFIVQQPDDGSSNSDWHYSLADLNQVVGCDRHLRDGGKGTGGYGFNTWRSGGNSGFGAGTVAMAVSVKCGPPTPRCIYQVTKVKNLADACGKVCDTCPYVRGDLVCLKAECRNAADCPSKLKGFNACANGASCKIIGALMGCDIPPRNCKRCR